MFVGAVLCWRWCVLLPDMLLLPVVVVVVCCCCCCWWWLLLLCCCLCWLVYSTFEIYQTEVKSKSLKESPVHTNEAFWRENITQFETNNFDLVGRLVLIVRDASEPAEVREIAAWDLGEFARFHPDGRRVVTKLGGKQALMLLMTEKNQKLAKAALLATQKIMVNNWEFLQKSSAAGVQSLVSNKK